MPQALVFSGSSHPVLATHIAQWAGVEQGHASFVSFPDQEFSLTVEDNVRGKEVFVVQTLAGKPHDFLMELLMWVDALKRASARRVTAVIPYMSYARQDRKETARGPITARLCANLLEAAGVDHVMTMDLHAEQIEGFFNVPVDHLHGWSLFAESMRGNSVIVAPDLGALKLARLYGEYLRVPFAVVDKQRVGAQSVHAGKVVGDVAGKEVWLVDDMCATGYTLVEATRAVRAAGATRVRAACTHAVFTAHALEVLQDSELEILFVTDTIPEHVIDPKITVVSVAPLFGKAIARVLKGESLQGLYPHTT